MGIIIKKVSNYIEILRKSDIPVILCSPTEKIIKALCYDNQERIRLNELLAEKLVLYSQDQRLQKAYEETKCILLKHSSPLFLEDFEMLFNPRYEIDVLRLFCEISRNRRITVNWCGEIHEDYLTFSLPEYKDYHAYKISDYDINCII